MFFNSIIIGVQLIFTIIIGIYFYNLLKNQQSNKYYLDKESKKELEKWNRKRNIKLTLPLSEKTRPSSLDDIIGQKDGIKALKAALCGPNPQHVIIYGTPGIGKTAAARVVLDEAKKLDYSPFNKDSKFIEMDATTLRFDERGIADPLIGSVHDPIYQGAGAYGNAGIPQPKAGAVTKAHGGILFIDEIGELHTVQMNKLLKVLEDRKVFLESSYYSSEDPNIPKHIHDIFQNGLPADFRLVGSTTRNPEEISPAIRSRCTEIFFKTLNSDELKSIAKNAIVKSGYKYDESILEYISNYANNGREAVNIVQTSESITFLERSDYISLENIQWVIQSGHYTRKYKNKVHDGYNIGKVNGLAVIGNNNGMLLEIEAISFKSPIKNSGKITITGIIEEEEYSRGNEKMRRKSTAYSSIKNVLTVLKNELNINYKDYDIHVNFPGGMPIDGPSAGIAIFTTIYSSITNKKVNNKLAMTGEISIKGNILPVGGVYEKIEAAIESGVDTVIIPNDNYVKALDKYSCNILPINNIKQLVSYIFDKEKDTNYNNINSKEILTAKGV